MEAMVKIVCTSVLLLWSVGTLADIVLLTSSSSKVATSLQILLSERLQTPVELVSNTTQPPNYDNYELAIAVGADAISAYSLPASLPVIAAFLSQADYLLAADDFASAIFVEPPFERQLRLAKAILGETSQFGSLVQSTVTVGALDSEVNVYAVNEFDSLNHSLIKLLAENQALIGVYDPLLYSSDNIKNILITAYRHNRPLIGPSSAYLRAGALATTYSNLEDVTSRLSDLVSHHAKTGVWLKADFNPYFHVGFNEQVGRSLNLLLPSIDSVTTKLRQQEASQ